MFAVGSTIWYPGGMSTEPDLHVGDIVKVVVPGKRAYLARVTEVRDDGIAVSNRTNLSGGQHPQAFTIRFYEPDNLAPATRPQRQAVERWEDGPGADLRARCRTPRRNGRR